jgi:hypothetical protein
VNLIKNFCLKKNFANFSALQIPEGQQHLSKAESKYNICIIITVFVQLEVPQEWCRNLFIS